MSVFDKPMDELRDRVGVLEERLKELLETRQQEAEMAPQGTRVPAHVFGGPRELRIRKGFDGDVGFNASESFPVYFAITGLQEYGIFSYIEPLYRDLKARVPELVALELWGAAFKLQRPGAVAETARILSKLQAEIRALGYDDDFARFPTNEVKLYCIDRHEVNFIGSLMTGWNHELQLQEWSKLDSWRRECIKTRGDGFFMYAIYSEFIDELHLLF